MTRQDNDQLDLVPLETILRQFFYNEQLCSLWYRAKEDFLDLPLFLGSPSACSFRSNYPPDMDQTESFCVYSADFNTKECGKFSISTLDGSL